MVGNVVVIAQDTPQEFVARRGPVTTMEVAHRFGWTSSVTNLRLLALRKEGKVQARLVRYGMGGQGGGGTCYEWTAPANKSE